MIRIIAAIGKNRELGKNNDLIWNLPNDLKFFKEQTKGDIVVMGSNTFFSLPKMLPGRKHIVLDDSNNNEYPEEVEVFSNLESLIEYIKDLDVWIIGGAMMYKTFLQYADQMFLTEINAEDDKAQVYFPEFNKNDWKKSILSNNLDNGIEYEHVVYERK